MFVMGKEMPNPYSVKAHRGRHQTVADLKREAHERVMRNYRPQSIAELREKLTAWGHEDHTDIAEAHAVNGAIGIWLMRSELRPTGGNDSAVCVATRSLITAAIKGLEYERPWYIEPFDPAALASAHAALRQQWETAGSPHLLKAMENTLQYVSATKPQNERSRA